MQILQASGNSQRAGPEPGVLFRRGRYGLLREGALSTAAQVGLANGSPLPGAHGPPAREGA